MHFFRESKIQKFGGVEADNTKTTNKQKPSKQKQFKFHYKRLGVKNTDNFLQDSDQNCAGKIYSRKCDEFINKAGKRSKNHQRSSDILTTFCIYVIHYLLNKWEKRREDVERKQIRMGCWLCWHFLKKRRWKRLMREDKKAENSGSGTNKQFKG